jgi:hypothetical protein
MLSLIHSSMLNHWGRKLETAFLQATAVTCIAPTWKNGPRRQTGRRMTNRVADRQLLRQTGITRGQVLTAVGDPSCLRAVASRSPILRNLFFFRNFPIPPIVSSASSLKQLSISLSPSTLVRSSLPFSHDYHSQALYFAQCCSGRARDNCHVTRSDHGYDRNEGAPSSRSLCYMDTLYST